MQHQNVRSHRPVIIVLSGALGLLAAACSSTSQDADSSAVNPHAGATEDTTALSYEDAYDDEGRYEEEFSGNAASPGSYPDRASQARTGGVQSSPPNVRAVQEANATSNNWGCDTDGNLALLLPSLSSSNQWGACCDTHDTCFEAYGCVASSWLENTGPCAQCNRQVFACMTNPVGPGPSLCTNPANNHPCGSYRSGPVGPR